MISPEAMQRMKTKVQGRVASTPPGTWGRIGAGVLLGGVAIGWLVFPYLLDKVIANQITLAEGKDSRRLWTQLPTFNCLFYPFNITNPEAVMRGARPIVQEVGPYCYKEVKDKTDMVEDPNTDTISYNARSTWYENQRDPSCPAPHLTGDEMLIIPNVPLLAVLLIAEKDFPPAFMTVVNQALPGVFGRLQDVFMRVSVRRLLFDGVHINCSARALYPRAVCIALKQNSRALKKLGNNQYEFSFFGAKNHTPEEFRYTVKRGIEKVQDIGRLVAVDGKPELPFWRGDCNKLLGTDSTVFPPFRQRENGSLAAYSSEVCRVVYGLFEGDYDYRGVKGYAYSASFGDSENNPGDRCFCPADDRCRKRGVLDALKCQGAPLIASHPHFYLGSPDYVNGVVGLSPDKEKHGILIVLEPISGSPLVARKRLQFNIDLKPISYIPLTNKLRRTLVPLIWVEEMLDLDSNLMGLLEGTLFLPIRAVDVIKWLCIVIGIGLGVTAAVLKFRKNRQDKVHILNSEEVEGAEEQPTAEFEPNPTLRIEDLEKHQQTHDPSYIPDNRPNTRFTQNGLSAAALMKTASTMTSENGAKQPSVDRTTSPPNLIVPNVDEQSLYFIQSRDNSLDSKRGLEVSKPFTPAMTIDITDNSAEEEVYPGLSSLQVRSPLALSGGSPTKSLELQLSSGRTSLEEPQLESIVENLTRGDSSNLSTSTRKITSPLESPQQDQVVPSHLITDNINTSFLETNATSFHRKEAVDTPKDKRPTTPINEIDTTAFGDLDLFGETISRNSTEGDSSVGQEFNNDEEAQSEAQEVTEHKINKNVSIGEETHKSSQPTDQEIKLVEKDINELIAEIAQLMPKNK